MIIINFFTDINLKWFDIKHHIFPTCPSFVPKVKLFSGLQLTAFHLPTLNFCLNVTISLFTPRQHPPFAG